MTTTPRPSSGDLFDDDPPSNSPDDLGFGRHRPERPPDVDRRPSRSKAYGTPSPGPDPVPVNHCSSAIQIEDARKFVAWLHDQDLPIHEDVTVGHVLVALSGWGTEVLAWLCRACRQAGRAPAPTVMRKAWLARDVGLLRPGEAPEEADDAPKN